MKSGIKTTEFWLSAIITLAGIIASVENPEQFGKIGIIISTIAVAVYTIGRNYMKSFADTSDK